MNRKSQWKSLLIGGAAVAALAFGTAAVYPQVSQAASDAPVTLERRGRAGFEIDVDHEALLADALGITVEELQAAQSTALNAAIDEAVAEGTLTEEEATALRERLEETDRPLFGLGRHFGRFGGAADFEALLADALGISVEELQAAETSAHEAALAEAVSEGDLTPEEADLLLAQRALHDYLEAQQPTHEETVQEALEAGAITQAQADLLLSNPPQGRGFGDHGFFGPGGHSRHGHGDGMPFRGEGRN